MLTVPKVTLPDDDATEDYGFSGLTNHKITLPGQYTAPRQRLIIFIKDQTRQPFLWLFPVK